MTKRKAFLFITAMLTVVVLTCLSLICLIVGCPALNVNADEHSETNIAAGKDLNNVQIISANNCFLTFENDDNNTGSRVICRGNIQGDSFIIKGNFYTVSNERENERYYFITEDQNFNTDFYIVNLEYERDKGSSDLTYRDKELISDDCIKIAIYMNDVIYYSEQSCDISESILDNAILLSLDQDIELIKTIASNISWFTYFSKMELELDQQDENHNLMSVNSTEPSLHEDMDEIDKAVLTKIGPNKFTKEQYVYGWIRVGSQITGGYLLESVEWPDGSGVILTNCLYYEFPTIVPSASSMSNIASIEAQLIVDRQYRWYPDGNYIDAFFHGSGFRLYDVKLALECAQYESGNGYDYIASRTVFHNKSESKKTDIALSIAKQFDKYHIIDFTETIFQLFTEDEKDNGESTCTWPSDFDQHYESVANGKKIHTMVRGVRVDTKGCLLKEEGNSTGLSAQIIDRDYSSSSTNVSMKKAIVFAFSYNLRKSNAFFNWLFGGDDCGEITMETYQTYIK